MKQLVGGFVIFLFSVLFYSGCEMGSCWHGTGQYTSQVYETGYFGEVISMDMFDIILVQDTVWYVELAGGDKVLEYASVNNTDSILYLHNSNECDFLRDYEKIKCYLHFTGRIRITLNEPCKLSSQIPVTSDMILIVPAEMSEVDIELNNTHLHFYNHRTTGGTYTFRGVTDNCVISGYYAARFMLSDLAAREMKLNNSSIGDMHVNVEDYLEVQIHNMGNIYYSGSPTIVIDSISGSGQLLPEN